MQAPKDHEKLASTLPKARLQKWESGKSIDPNSTEDPNICAYCHKPGHSILKYFKLTKDQAPAKSDGNLETEKATAAPSVAHMEYIEDDVTGLISLPTIGSTKRKFAALPVSDSTGAALAFGGSETLGVSDQLIVDTGANISVVMNSLLLHQIESCNSVTFDGLHGNLKINTTGSLMGICKAYHHPEAVANILSFSQLKDLSHDIIYNQQYDKFILRFEVDKMDYTSAMCYRNPTLLL